MNSKWALYLHKAQPPAAHKHTHTHKIQGITQGQTPQTCFNNKKLIGSSGHQGQRWSAGEMPSVALKSLAITQIDCFVVSGCASGHNHNLVQAGSHSRVCMGVVSAKRRSRQFFALTFVLPHFCYFLRSQSPKPFWPALPATWHAGKPEIKTIPAQVILKEQKFEQKPKVYPFAGRDTSN
jgi:hypothetical protein